MASNNTMTNMRKHASQSSAASVSSTSSIQSAMSYVKAIMPGRKSEEERAAKDERKATIKALRSSKSPAYGYGASPGYVTLGY